MAHLHMFSKLELYRMDELAHELSGVCCVLTLSSFQLILANFEPIREAIRTLFSLCVCCMRLRSLGCTILVSYQVLNSVQYSYVRIRYALNAYLVPGTYVRSVLLCTRYVFMHTCVWWFTFCSVGCTQKIKMSEDSMFTS